MIGRQELWKRLAGAIALSAAVLGSSCSSAPPESSLGQRWLDALNSHDAAQVAPLLATDAVYRDPTAQEPLGVAALSARLTREWTQWKDRVYTAIRIVDAPDTVVIEWHLQQTHPTGKAVPLDGVTILDRDGTRIRAVRDYYNAGVYLQFLRSQ